jgi:hypothetical protein
VGLICLFMIFSDGLYGVSFHSIHPFFL